MLALCVCSFSLAACSDRTDGPKRVETDDTPGKTVTEGFAPEDTVEPGYIERTVGGMVLREEESVLRIEEAELQRGEGGDQIVVRAFARGPADYRGCFLMEERAWLATDRAIESGNASEAPSRLESFWADPNATEEFSGENTFARVFREDPEPGGASADPSETPFFVLCFIDADPSSLDTRTTWYDVSHVEGTPEPSW